MLADLFDPAFADSVARIAVPILLASLGGAICHRAGVFNIALEGFILMGAFAAVLGSFMLGHVFWGVLCAILAGIFMGLLFAEFHLRRPGDASPGLRRWNSANSKPINMPASIAHKTPQKTWPNIKLPRTAAKAPIKMKPSNAMLKTPAL